MIFKNPSNDYIEESSLAWLWTLLFGCFYFAVKGVWSHVLISFCLGLFTCGLSWIVYPFFASGIIRKSYLKKGWIERKEYDA